MATEIKAPVFPESVADGTVATWHKKVGEPVSRDEVLADIETDKVVLEVVAPADGVLTQIIKNEGDTVLSAEVLAQFEAGSGAAAAPQQAQAEQTQAGPAPIVARQDAPVVADQSPAVRKAVAENGLNPADITGTGRGGRVTKEDVATHLSAPKPAAAPAPGATTRFFYRMDE